LVGEKGKVVAVYRAVLNEDVKVKTSLVSDFFLFRDQTLAEVIVKGEQSPNCCFRNPESCVFFLISLPKFVR